VVKKKTAVQDRVRSGTVTPWQASRSSRASTVRSPASTFADGARSSRGDLLITLDGVD